MHTYFDSYFHSCLLFKCYSSVQRGGILGLYYKSCPFTSHIFHFHCFSDKEVKKLLMASGAISFTEPALWNTWRINAWIHFNVKKKKKFYWWFSGPLRGSVYFSKISLVAECKCLQESASRQQGHPCGQLSSVAIRWIERNLRLCFPRPIFIDGY